MQSYRVTAKIEYIAAISGNTKTAEFSIDQCQSMSGEENIKKAALAIWLDSQYAPDGIVKSDIKRWIRFRAEPWTDEETSAKHGAIQKGLF